MEKNKILAKFIGATLVCVDMYFIESLKTYVSKSNLNFDTSWDSLMIVVNKIEELGNDVIIGSDYIKITFDEGKDFILIENVNIKLDAVYNACVEFIEIYEENKLSK